MIGLTKNCDAARVSQWRKWGMKSGRPHWLRVRYRSEFAIGQVLPLTGCPTLASPNGKERGYDQLNKATNDQSVQAFDPQAGPTHGQPRFGA